MPEAGGGGVNKEDAGNVKIDLSDLGGLGVFLIFHCFGLDGRLGE